MRLLTVVCCLLAGCCLAEWTAAATPLPIDPPSPPPCSPDGSCYPNRNTWGWYQARWRRWPGDEFVPAAAEPTPADRLGPDLTPYEPPSAEREDERAPPSTTRGERPDDEEPESGPPAPPSETPGAPMTTPYESPRTVPFGEPTSDLDPPPALPISLSAGIAPAPSARSGSGPHLGAPRTVGTLDPPPTPPWSHSAGL